jgi:mevalonate kinase
MARTSAFASAPGKIILFGEHGVNRHQPALATAVDLRVFCQATVRPDGRYTFRSGKLRADEDREHLLVLKADIDALRAAGAHDALRARTDGDFFAPARYVLAHIVERTSGSGLDIVWRSQLPIGSGLGSGAAAAAAMVMATARLAGWTPGLAEIADLAWQGDAIAHGGVASGLDSGACAFGGLIRYTLADGSQPLPSRGPLPLVIGDTQVRANTSEVNTRVRLWLREQPARMHVFAEMGLLVRHAARALESDDLIELGHLMNLNELLLEKLGVSCPEIDRLVDAALGAGALGAKLSGSGGGGIIIALADHGQQDAVAAAIDAAGGRSIVADAGTPGVRIEDEASWAHVGEQTG